MQTLLANNASVQSWNDLEKRPESAVRIRFSDCDPYGHLNNGRYLEYFIRMREDHLRDHYQLDLYSQRFKERNWVVRQSLVSHLLPAMLNAEVIIRTALIDYSRTGVVVEALMLNSDRSSLLAASWADFRYIDLGSGRPAKHEDDLMDLFAAVRIDTGFTFGAEKKRIIELKRSLQAAA